MTDPYGSPEQVLATVRAQVAAADARTAAIETLAADVAATTATARSLRGEVEVTAASSGVIRDVRLSEDALALPATDLSRLVTETTMRAQRDAAERALHAAEETLGTENPLVVEMRDEVRSRPEPPAAPGTRPTL